MFVLLVVRSSPSNQSVPNIPGPRPPTAPLKKDHPGKAQANHTGGHHCKPPGPRPCQPPATSQPGQPKFGNPSAIQPSIHPSIHPGDCPLVSCCPTWTVAAKTSAFSLLLPKVPPLDIAARLFHLCCQGTFVSCLSLDWPDWEPPKLIHSPFPEQSSVCRTTQHNRPSPRPVTRAWAQHTSISSNSGCRASSSLFQRAPLRLFAFAPTSSASRSCDTSTLRDGAATFRPSSHATPIWCLLCPPPSKPATITSDHSALFAKPARSRAEFLLLHTCPLSC